MCYSWQNSNQTRKLFVSHYKPLVIFVGWGPMVVHQKRCFYSLRVPCSNWNLCRNFQIVIFHFNIRLVVGENLTINISRKIRVFYLQPTLQFLQPTRPMQTVNWPFFLFCGTKLCNWCSHQFNSIRAWSAVYQLWALPHIEPAKWAEKMHLRLPIVRMCVCVHVFVSVDGSCVGMCVCKCVSVCVCVCWTMGKRGAI